MCRVGRVGQVGHFVLVADMGNASTNGIITDELRPTPFPSTDGRFRGITIAGPEKSRVHRGHRDLRLHHIDWLVISMNALAAERTADDLRWASVVVIFMALCRGAAGLRSHAEHGNALLGLRFLLLVKTVEGLDERATVVGSTTTA